MTEQQQGGTAPDTEATAAAPDEAHQVAVAVADDPAEIAEAVAEARDRRGGHRRRGRVAEILDEVAADETALEAAAGAEIDRLVDAAAANDANVVLAAADAVDVVETVAAVEAVEEEAAADAIADIVETVAADEVTLETVAPWSKCPPPKMRAASCRRDRRCARCGRGRHARAAARPRPRAIDDGGAARRAGLRHQELQAR